MLNAGGDKEAYSVPGSWIFARKLVYRRHFESREGQMASTSYNIRDNKRNVEQMLKQSLNALILNSFNIDSTSIVIQQVSTRFQGGGN